MGPVNIIVLLIGITSFTKACPGCKEVSPYNAIIHQYLANTVQSLPSPKGLQPQEKIEVVHILKANFQVMMGIKFFYAFEGRGSRSKNVYVCDLVLIRRAWLNERKIEKYECHHSKAD